MSEQNLSVDKNATYKKIRQQYGSVQSFCREKEFSSQMFYSAINRVGRLHNHADLAHKIIDTLTDEALLVRNNSNNLSNVN